MKKSENKPIFVDVKFEESLSKEHCLYIMLELVKNLIYQRRQIPLTFETLKREILKYYNIIANVSDFNNLWCTKHGIEILKKMGKHQNLSSEKSLGGRS